MENNVKKFIIDCLLIISYYFLIFFFKDYKLLLLIYPLILFFIFFDKQEKIETKNRILIVLLVSFFFFVVIPFEIFLSNRGEFQVYGKDFAKYISLVYFNGLLIAAGLCFLFRKNNCFDKFLLFLFLSYIVNGILIPLNAGVLSGFIFQNQVKIFSPTIIMFIEDIVITILIVFIVNSLFLGKRKIIVWGLAFIIVIFCSINISLYIKNKDIRVHIPKISSSLPPAAKKIHTFAKEKRNVVVFMVDMMNGNYVEKCLENEPSFYDMFSGFTWYKDLLSVAGSTVSSLPSLLGGEQFSPIEMNKTDNTYKEDSQKAIGNFFIPFIKNGWKAVEVYGWGGVLLSRSHLKELNIDDSNYYLELCQDYIGYWLNKRKMSYPLTEGKKYLLSILPLYQLAPNVLKQYIYDKSNWLNPSIQIKQRQQHVLVGLAHLDLLSEISSVSSNENGTFLYVQNSLPHDPYGINSQGELITKPNEIGDNKLLAYYSAKKALLCIEKFIIWLKENDIYDNTMIIIVSDHGNFVQDNEVIDFYDDPRAKHELSRAHATLMVKDFNSAGRLNINNKAQLQNCDVYSIIQEKVFSNGTGFTDLLTNQKDRERLYSVCLDDKDYPNRKRMKYHSYRVVGSMFNKESWERLKEDN